VAAKQVWTKAELKFIRKNADRVKDKDLAEQLTRITGRQVTLHAVRHVRLRLGIMKAAGHGVCRVLSRKNRRRPKY
jgi:hypothetical protein